MNLLIEIHWCTQYLVGAAKSFLQPQPDDSHTSLGFDAQKGCLFTRDLQGRGVLEYGIAEKKIRWPHGNVELDLQGKKHEEIVRALHMVFADAGFDRPYRFELHYELPYPRPQEGYSFPETRRDTLEKHTEFRKLGQMALEGFAEKNDLDAEVRVWPHHYDTGIYLPEIGSGGWSVGMGLAIPDSMIDEYYFYTSAYLDGMPIDPRGFPDLPQPAFWISGTFKGGILRSRGIDLDRAIDFLNRSLLIYEEQSQLA